MGGLNLEEECQQFVYLQVFDWNVMTMSNDLILFGLNSREKNEGLPFIQSACVQIIKERENGDDGDDEKEKNDDLYDVMWKFEIMKGQFMSALEKVKDCKIRIEIEWESGFD